MSKYLARVSLNTDGVRLLRKDKASGRSAAVAKMVEAGGGKVEGFYYAFGSDDVIMICDFSDNPSAVAASLVANSGGQSRVSVTPLITVEEMDRAVDKAAKLPSPAPQVN